MDTDFPEPDGSLDWLERPLTARHDHVLEEHLDEALRAAHLDWREKTLLVAVSGGPDSTALLRALVSLRWDLGLYLHVVHVDHGLRLDSAADATYVRRLAERWSMYYTIREVNVRRLRSDRGLSLEDAARQARYAALAQVAARIDAGAVLVGHTANDQTETVLLNLLRGTGLRGLAGMELVGQLPPVPGEPPLPPVPLVRPLLKTTRAEVESYLRFRRLRPRRDPSNLSPMFLRNRVRSELVPLLEDLHPGAGEAVRRAAGAVREVLDFLEAAVEDARSSAVRREDGSLFLDLDRLATLHPAVLTSLLQRAVEEIAGTREGFTARHWESMAGLLAARAPGTSLDLPHGLRLTMFYGEASLTPGPARARLPALALVDLPLPGGIRAGEWAFRATRTPKGTFRLEAMTSDSGLAHLPLAGPLAVELPGDEELALGVRGRRPGDRVRLRGGGRKLQDILTDARVPRSWRDRVPVVFDKSSGEIIWVVGVAATGRVRQVSPRESQPSRMEP